ncbi:MAG: conserved rane protein of unknown function [Frankiales bacterium]|nr:conserved rane protein of unknown function [Frankiales bacterium]
MTSRPGERNTVRVSWTADYFADPAHGPLPALLLGLTVATGIVDAVSILRLGRVFVANMTGNIAFTGFALAGAPGFVLDASLVALVGFLVGAALGGAANSRFGAHRGRLARNVATAEVLFLVAALVITVVVGDDLGTVPRDCVVALAAVALGLQNAAVRRLAVPDLTTTVLTMTLTGVAADLRNRNLRVALRRGLSVGAMLLGAVGGALLVLRVSVPAALGAVVAVVAVVAVGAAVASRQPAAWHTFAAGR